MSSGHQRSPVAVESALPRFSAGYQSAGLRCTAAQTPRCAGRARKQGKRKRCTGGGRQHGAPQPAADACTILRGSRTRHNRAFDIFLSIEMDTYTKPWGIVPRGNTHHACEQPASHALSPYPVPIVTSPVTGSRTSRGEPTLYLQGM